MKEKTKKKKSDAAFIAKIKTLNIGTGAKRETIDGPPCDICGKPMQLEHIATIELQKVNLPAGTNPANN